MSTLKYLLAGALLFASGRCELRAQTYSIDLSTINGGGGTSSGGPFSLSGSIGQPAAGKISGENYTIDNGFWGVIQQPGAPSLSITASNNFVDLSWPGSAAGFVLEQNDVLSATNLWSVVAQSPSTNNGQISVTVPTVIGSRFYRLKY